MWIAEGTYNENIMLKDGVALFGGFTGLGQLEETSRRRETGVTTL